MLRSLNRLWALAALVMSSPALALGLGEIRLDSALNEPLRADIVLLSATEEELDALRVAMASTDTFVRYGLDRPAYLNSVQFRIIRSGRTDGNIIRLTSLEPFTEPFLTFLIEASWTRGRLLREYTVLLDPPTFAPPPTEPVTQTVQPPVRSQPADSGQISRPAPAPAPAPQPAAPAPRATMPSSGAAPSPAPSAPSQDPQAPPTEAPAPVPQPEPAGFDTTSPGQYRVLAGDTLWSIASRYLPDNRLTVNQAMLAIYEANPDAFEGNINRMTAGASLRIPSADDIFSISRADALAEVQRQHSAWQPGAGPAPAAAATGPSLELVPPDDETVAEDTSSGYEGPADTADTAATTGSSLDDIRIAEIEELLADQQDGLVVIADNELAALRRELAELRGEPLPVEEPAEPAADAAGDEIFVDDETTDVADEAVADDAEPVAADDAAVETDAEAADAMPAPRPVAQPQPAPQAGIVDTVMGYLTSLWGMVGIAIVLVVLAVGVFLVRRSRGEDDEGVTPWDSLDRDTGPEATQQVPSLGDDETIVVEESLAGNTINEPPRTATLDEMSAKTMEIQGSPAGDSDDETAEARALADPTEQVFAADSAPGGQAMEDTFSSETALNLDQSDPIAEADFHMAYGLYDQAADLINGALDVDPGNSDLLAKLCEVYFVWGNRDAFIDAAERFKAQLGGGEDPEWDKTVIMGQQIAGDHELFAGAQAGGTQAVDLSFDDDTGAGELDIDFAGSTGESPAVGGSADDGLDFVFDDEESGATTTSAVADDPFADAFAEQDEEDDGGTTEMPTAEMPSMDDATAEMPGMESAPEDGTAEMPAIGDNEATELASLDDLDDAADSRADATAEIDLDDLGLDLEGIGDDLDSTATGPALEYDLDATGRNEAIDEAVDDAAETGRNEALEDDRRDLLDATGQTQILPDDFTVETGTGTNIEKALADDDDLLADDAETKLASLDDDNDDTDIGEGAFAATEVLPVGQSGDPVGSRDDLADTDLSDLEMDLDELTAALDVSVGVNTGTDDDDDEATRLQPLPSANGDDSPTSAYSPDDLSDDLNDARTMTEVGTKLDLARAYVDMGDPGGARSILEEVLDEGDDSQRQQAQQLLDSLPA